MLNATESKLADIVHESFNIRPMPSGKITASEIVRRTGMVQHIWNTLYDEAGWSHQRILDHMTQYLIRMIDGVGIPAEATRRAYDDESVMWSPETSNRVEREQRMSALSIKTTNK